MQAELTLRRENARALAPKPMIGESRMRLDPGLSGPRHYFVSHLGTYLDG